MYQTSVQWINCVDEEITGWILDNFVQKCSEMLMGDGLLQLMIRQRRHQYAILNGNSPL